VRAAAAPAATALAVVTLALLGLAITARPALAQSSSGVLAYGRSQANPHVHYVWYWSVPNKTTVKSTRVSILVHNPQRSSSTKNWVSISIRTGGSHPAFGGSPWDGHAAWSGVGAPPIPADQWTLGADTATRRATTSVWYRATTTGSGAWRTFTIPSGSRLSTRYGTWMLIKLHGAGCTQYWYRLTPPIG
jgi:hypothetical protein